MQFTKEQMNKALAAKSAEELLAMAKAEGIEMTEEEAKLIFAELHKEGELTDAELDAVAGGKEEDYEAYPPRKSDWFVCDTSNFSCRHCGNCVCFHYYPEGMTKDGCDGYCMRGAWRP